MHSRTIYAWDLPRIRGHLRRAMPALRSSHLAEGLAAALGFKTAAALQSALRPRDASAAGGGLQLEALDGLEWNLAVGEDDLGSEEFEDEAAYAWLRQDPAEDGFPVQAASVPASITIGEPDAAAFVRRIDDITDGMHGMHGHLSAMFEAAWTSAMRDVDTADRRGALDGEERFFLYRTASMHARSGISLMETVSLTLGDPDASAPEEAAFREAMTEVLARVNRGYRLYEAMRGYACPVELLFLQTYEFAEWNWPATVSSDRRWMPWTVLIQQGPLLLPRMLVDISPVLSRPEAAVMFWLGSLLMFGQCPRDMMGRLLQAIEASPLDSPHRAYLQAAQAMADSLSQGVSLCSYVRRFYTFKEWCHADLDPAMAPDVLAENLIKASFFPPFGTLDRDRY